MTAVLVLYGLSPRPAAIPTPEPLPPAPPMPPPGGAAPAVTVGTRLSQGTLRLNLPLLTLYEPVYNGSGFTTTTSVTFTSTPGESSNVTFEWSRPAGTTARVRFIEQHVSHLGVVPREGAFQFFPAGNCTEGCAAVQIGFTTAISGYGILLVGSGVRVAYEVWEMHLLPPFEFVSWLEVRYALGTWFTQLAFLPAANVTEPGAEDLVTVGSPRPVIEGPGTFWSASFDVQDFELPMSVFRFTGSPIEIDAGPLGTLTTYLTSSFSWSNLTTYRIAMNGDSLPEGQHLAFQFYLDTRFGSLQARAVV